MARPSRLGRLLGRADASQATTPEPERSVGAEPGLPVDTSLVTDSPHPGGSGFDVVVTVAESSYRDGAHLPVVRAARAAGAGVVVVAPYDVHAGPSSTYPVVAGGDDHVVARPTVAATWGGAVATARPLLESAAVVVQDASVSLPEGATTALVAALTREAPVALAVVRTVDDVVASAGAALVHGSAPVASVLRGHPAEDAEALAGTTVFAGGRTLLRGVDDSPGGAGPDGGHPHRGGPPHPRHRRRRRR